MDAFEWPLLFFQSSALTKKKIVHYTSYDNNRKRANAAYLVGAYAVSLATRQEKKSKKNLSVRLRNRSRDARSLSPSASTQRRSIVSSPLRLSSTSGAIVLWDVYVLFLLDNLSSEIARRGVRFADLGPAALFAIQVRQNAWKFFVVRRSYRMSSLRKRIVLHVPALSPRWNQRERSLFLFDVYRDASCGSCTFHLSLHDVFSGLHKVRIARAQRREMTPPPLSLSPL